MRVTSTRPAGMRCFSLSAEGIEPVSSSASIFSAIVLPTPASSSARPCLRELLDRHAGLADRLRGVAVGHHAVHDRAVQLVQAGRAPRRPPLSRRCASAASLRAALPGAWLILPTYNEAENIEPLVRAALRAAGDDRARAHGPGRGRQLARRHRRDRRPAGRGARRRCGCCTGRASRASAAPTSPASSVALGGGRRAGARDGLRLLARPRRPAAADRGRRRRRPGARLALRAGRRRGELGRAAAAALARRLVVRARSSSACPCAT